MLLYTRATIGCGEQLNGVTPRPPRTARGEGLTRPCRSSGQALSQRDCCDSVPTGGARRSLSAADQGERGAERAFWLKKTEFWRWRARCAAAVLSCRSAAGAGGCGNAVRVRFLDRVFAASRRRRRTPRCSTSSPLRTPPTRGRARHRRPPCPPLRRFVRRRLETPGRTQSIGQATRARARWPRDSRVNFATTQGRLLPSPGAHVDGVLLGFGRRGRQKDANAVGRILVGPSAISLRLGSLELLNPPRGALQDVDARPQTLASWSGRELGVSRSLAGGGSSGSSTGGSCVG